MKSKIYHFDSRYTIFENGTILGAKGKFIKLQKHPTGYVYVNMAGHTKKLHRIVAFAFIPNPNNLPDVNHLDGDKTNNNASNLEWANDSSNHLHAFRMGLKTHKGSKNPRSILSECQITSIRARLNSRESGLKLAKEFKVKKSTIYAIRYGDNWATS